MRLGAVAVCWSCLSGEIYKKNKKIVKGRNKTVPATEQQIVEECRNLISMKHNKMYLQKLTAFLAEFISVFVSCFRKLSGGLLSGFEFLSQDRQFFFCCWTSLRIRMLVLE